MSTEKPTVAVIGLGAIGSMTLWRLATRGVDVTGFEKSTPGHDAAAYGGSTRQLRLASHDAHSTEHVQLAGRSLPLWNELEDLTGRPLYLRTGQLAVGPGDDHDLITLIRSLEREGLGHRILTAEEVGSRYPAHSLAEDEIGILSEEAGILRSNHAVYAAVAAAESLGANVHRQARVRSIDSTADGIVVTVGGARERFDHVVVTTGPWVGELVPALRDPVTVRKIVSAWFEARPGVPVTPDAFPPGFRRSRDGHSYTFLPAVDDTPVKVIYWIPFRPEVDNTSHWDRRAEPETLAGTRAALEATMPGLEPTPTDVEVYLEGFTADRWPIVHTSTRGLTILAGFSGGGFAVSPFIGELAAELALGLPLSHDISSMAADRLLAR